jgi:hypothetical protein
MRDVHRFACPVGPASGLGAEICAGLGAEICAVREV